MRKASLLSGIGVVVLLCGMAGLDGPTPDGCALVTLAGMTMILVKIVIVFAKTVLADIARQNKQRQRALQRRRTRRKSEFFEVWETCRMK